MKNVKFLMLKKFNDKSEYIEVSKHIYKAIKSGFHFTALSCELEEGEDEQYPLEDMLDHYYVNCTNDFQVQECDGVRVLLFELQGSLGNDIYDIANLKKIIDIFGKRVYNKTENGLVKLVVE